MSVGRTGTWHVAHVIGTLSTGGAERSVVNYILNADRHDFRHTVICLGSRGEMAPTVEAADVPVHVLRIRRRHLPLSLLRLAHWLRREKVDVLHTHMFEAALWGRIAGRLAGVPVMVTTLHGPELWKGRLHVGVDRWLNRWTARHIAVARDGLEIRVRLEHVRPDRILLIPNGVTIPAQARDPELARRTRAEFGLPPEAPVLGSVGRFVFEKGYEHLLEALKLARVEVPDLRWLAVGDGTLRPALTARAASEGLGDAVIWAGLRQDVETLLPAMDLWVMSSVEEGLPVALLEAMATGCPIVATRVGGIPDAVGDGREAVLVPPAEPTALATAIVQLLRNPERARQMGDAARARAEAEYSIHTVTRRLENIYREELARVSPASRSMR
jgi:glycosyltransferase involved in cell wall biosynthesis